MTETQANRVVVTATPKSVGVAIILSLLFGPLGMLYSTVTGGIVMFFVNVAAFFMTAGLGLILTWPIGVIWAAMAADGHNKKLRTGGA